MTEQVKAREEFDALPVGSVIRRERDFGRPTNKPVVAEKIRPGQWLTTRGEWTISTDSLLRDEVPYTVLYNPDRPGTRDLPSREDISDALHGDECIDDPDGETCLCDVGHYDRQADIVLALLRGETDE